MTNPNVAGKPATGAFAVTPSDSVDFAVTARSLYVGGAGDVTLVTMNGEVVTYYNVPVGSIIPQFCTRVNATATDATYITGMY
jgi:hypothetical protein